MQRRDKILLILLAAQIPLFAALYRFRSNSQMAPVEMTTLTAEQVIGNRANITGMPDAPYTLVEFGDYQCPPCAALAPKVEELVRKNSKILNFRFRHFPLSMHKFAMEAAQISELSRKNGTFHQFHQEAYALKAQFNPQTILDLARKHGIDYANVMEAEKVELLNQVQKDIEQGESIRVDSTPTFILCAPNKKIWKINTLSQIDSLLNP